MVNVTEVEISRVIDVCSKRESAVKDDTQALDLRGGMDNSVINR